MGLRYRKGISLLPGVRLNIAKQGPSSISIGGRGFTYNIGKKGTRATGGIPGSGLSYSHYDKYGAKAAPAQTHEVIDKETGEITHVPVQAAQQTVSPVAFFSNMSPLLKVFCFAALALAVNYFQKN